MLSLKDGLGHAATMHGKLARLPLVDEIGCFGMVARPAGACPVVILRVVAHILAEWLPTLKACDSSEAV